PTRRARRARLDPGGARARLHGAGQLARPLGDRAHLRPRRRAARRARRGQRAAGSRARSRREPRGRVRAAGARMTPGPLAPPRVRPGGSLADAVRRRIALALVVLSLLSLLVVDSCTSCASGTIMVNGAPVEGSRVFGWTGMILYALVALWTIALSGALAS